MERVVYLLGAGFSAPLGLPVMSNFLEKSKDIYFENKERYHYFSDVLDQIRDFSIVKNYYKSDLFNIEEILSILEMANQLGGRRLKLKKDFIRYLSDVVEYYTPPLKPYLKPLPSNWEDVLFSADPRQNGYGYFFAAVQNLQITRYRLTFDAAKCPSPKAIYSLITLNYDLVLENFSDHLLSSYSGFLKDQITLVSDLSDELQPFSERTILAKLHGSVGLDNIVPPTWSKGVDRKILAAWRIAYRALVEATQIRIIGYSLPEADAYVKYLLKAAVMKAPHLKRFDVLCLDDPDRSVQQRYEAFVDFPKYRFLAKSLTEYLDLHRKLCSQKKRREEDTWILEFNFLEEAHHQFFGKE